MKLLKHEIKIILGPHHGEKAIPISIMANYQSAFEYDISDMRDLLGEKEGQEHTYDLFMKLKDRGYYIYSNWVEGFEHSEKDMRDFFGWGDYLFLEMDLTKPYQLESFERFMKLWRELSIRAFATAGGDDDTYDYTPSFIETYEQLLEYAYGKGEIKIFRKELYNTDPEYPEFFSDEELEEFKN